jgi:hypothetical protein
MSIHLYHQRQLILACLDDFTPNATLQDYMGGQFGNETHTWQVAVVDFIYQNMKRDLIMILPGQCHYAEKNCDEIKQILLNGDINEKIESTVIWNIIYFQGTNKLKKIMHHFCLDDWSSLGLGLNEKLRDVIDRMQCDR